VFVQDIDARKPLSGRFRSQSGAPSRDEPERQGTLGTRDEEVASTQENEVVGQGQGSTDQGSSAQGPMLTSEVAVDERLRQMNATFIASLEGLSSGRRERKQSESGGEDAWSSPSTGPPTPGDISGSGSARRGLPRAGGTGIRRGNMLLLTQHSPGSGSPSGSFAAAGSEEVIGRLELDDGLRQP
jgi:autophagy-related protein 13